MVILLSCRILPARCLFVVVLLVAQQPCQITPKSVAPKFIQCHAPESLKLIFRKRGLRHAQHPAQVCVDQLQNLLLGYHSPRRIAVTRFSTSMRHTSGLWMYRRWPSSVRSASSNLIESFSV